MSNKIWNVITHHETPAFGVGDYDEYYEIVNEREDALQATEYEGLEQIADALNGYQGNLRITTALEINLHCDNQMLKMELEQLKAENSKMRKALEWYANAGNYITDRGEIASAYQRDRIADKATEALKTNTHG